ncbi:MAG: glycosyltransferase family 1 protein [wastewater metagenome]|nr:glycosyltransferase family 1 protein [Candidatus Loosdrechtia aerotolerans]
MNVLQVNKFHYLRGGSERVYFGTADILAQHGHKVNFFSMVHPENVPCDTSQFFMSDVDVNSNSINPVHQIKIAFRILYSSEAKERISRLLDEYPVDIVHLHNIHHQISPSILDVLKKRKIPAVMTLHDYKMVCASYSLLAHDEICERCSGGKYYRAIHRRCLKGSFIKSSLAAMEMYLHHTFLNIYKNVDIFISPSMFLKKKLIDMGFKKTIVYLPNFVTRFDAVKNETNGEIHSDEYSLVYFGRLSREKGVSTLIKAAKILQAEGTMKIKFKIIGDGPLKSILEKRVENEGIHNVQFFGYMRGETLYNEIKRSTAVILPSEWYENNPVSVLEAFALGKPVISARIGGIPELVSDNGTGLTFQSGNAEDLVEKIIHMFNSRKKIAEMGENARVFVHQNFSVEKYYQGLMNIYQLAREKRKNGL